MRRLYSALGAIVLMLGLTLFHIQTVNRETGQLLNLLEQVDQAVEAGDWTLGRSRMAEAEGEWQRVEQWFGMVLRMGDTEEVDKGFQELRETLRQERLPEFRSSSAALSGRVKNLSEGEQLSWGNIF